MSNILPPQPPPMPGYAAQGHYVEPPKKKNWGLRIFLGILGALFIGFIGMIILLVVAVKGQMSGGRTTEREASSSSADTLVIRFNQPMRDSAPAPFAQMFGGGWVTPHQVVAAIQKAGGDSKIKRLFISPGLGMMPGWGRTEEIRDAVVAFRGKGKKAYGYAEFADMQGYYLLSACDQIAMPEGGDLLVNGFMAQFPLYKGPLMKIGITPEFIHHGKFKSYSEAFMNDEISPENRQQLDELVGGLYDHFVAAVVAGRGSAGQKLTPEEVKAQIDHGFFIAPDAKIGKLIDTIAYSDQYEETLGGKGGLKKTSVRRYLGLQDGPQAQTGGNNRPHVAVLHATGDIVSGEANQGAFGGGDDIASDTFIRNLREVGANEDAKVLLLAIDSPGGSALASDVIWRELTRLREKKKIIISMGNVAASGGYYMAMGGSHIFALPTTITGSIGVVSGRFNLGELYKKFDYKRAVVTRGANADLFNEQQPLRPEQIELLTRNMDATYLQFITHVAENRKKTTQEIDDLGQGRVYAGAAALKLGLIDELGGFTEAAVYARKAANLPDNAPLVDYPPQKDFFAALFQKKDEMAQDRAMAQLPAELRESIIQARRLETLTREPVLLYEPLVITQGR